MIILQEMSKFNKDWLSYACFELYIVQIGSNLPSKWLAAEDIHVIKCA